jgi:hypothetical protein
MHSCKYDFFQPVPDKRKASFLDSRSQGDKRRLMISSTDGIKSSDGHETDE